MDWQSAGNEPPPDTGAEPAAIKLPDDIVRKQQVLRRHLQDPASPAFNDPLRAAELAGFPVMRQSRGHRDPDGRPTLFYNNLSIRQTVLDAASRKAARIEKLRQRVSEGMDATKIVIVSDDEGVRRSVEVPDQAARREWALVCARLENLLPGKGGDPSSDTLPHDAAQAQDLERLRESDVEYQVSRMSAADRCLLSDFLLKLSFYRQRLRRQVTAGKLGKPIEEFEDEVEQEVKVKIKQIMSALRNGRSQGMDRNEGES